VPTNSSAEPGLWTWIVTGVLWPGLRPDTGSLVSTTFVALPIVAVPVPEPEAVKYAYAMIAAITATSSVTRRATPLFVLKNARIMLLPRYDSSVVVLARGASAQRSAARPREKPQVLDCTPFTLDQGVR